MENIAQGLLANLFASTVAAPGAPATAQAGLISGLFAQGEPDEANGTEFLQILDGLTAEPLAPASDGELVFAPAPPETSEALSLHTVDNAIIDFAPDDLETPIGPFAVSADTSKQDSALVSSGDVEIGTTAFDGTRAKPLLNSTRADFAQNPAAAEELAQLPGKATSPDETATSEILIDREGVDLPRRISISNSQDRFLLGAQVAARPEGAGPKPLTIGVEQSSADAAKVFGDESLPLVTTLNATHERAAAPATVASAPDVAAKAGAQIVAAISTRGMDTTIEVRLNPPELGRIMIDFEGRGADIVRATVAAEAPETLELMRRNMDLLQRELEKSGLANIDLQFRDSSHQSDERRQDELARLGREQPDEIAAQMSKMSPQAIALSFDGRLDRRF